MPIRTIRGSAPVSTNSQLPNILLLLANQILYVALKAESVFEIWSIAFLISLLDRSRYLKHLLRGWLVNPGLDPTSTGKHRIPLPNLLSDIRVWGQHTCTFFSCWLVQSSLARIVTRTDTSHLFFCSGNWNRCMVTSGRFAVTEGSIAGLLSTSQTIPI